MIAWNHNLISELHSTHDLEELIKVFILPIVSKIPCMDKQIALLLLSYSF